MTGVKNTGVSNLRALAALAIGRVYDQKESLDFVLDELSPSLAESDRGLFRELVYGSLRWHGAYSERLKAYLKKAFKPKDRCLHHLLVSACYQLDFLETAPHAVVNETVSASKALNRIWAKGLLNGVLRSIQRSQWSKPDSAKEIEACFPTWFCDELKMHWPAQLESILKASNQKPPMTLRVNLLRTSRQDYLAILEKAEIKASACEYSETGIMLKQALPVAKLPHFNEGFVSVQDESAQLVAPLLSLKDGQRVLDACSAPGGKTAHILEAGTRLDEVQALDFEARLPRFHQNMLRLDLHPTVIAADATKLDSWWDEEPFDRVLLDVPCTGTGVIRRHPDIRFRRKPTDVEQFVSLQLALLQSTWQVLKPGGLLLYTTCSILPQENEQLVLQFLALQSDARVQALPDFLGIATGSGRQRLTGVHSGDGFYYSLLSKT